MTIPVPKLPTDYQYVPISPDDLTKAQVTVPSTGQRISITLAILATLVALYTLFSLAGIFWLGQNFNSLLEQLFLSFKEPVPNLPPFPTWATFSLLILTFISGIIPIWGIWIARRTILAITQQVTEPSTEATEELMNATKAIQPWLLLGKWTPILSLILGFVFTFAVFMFIYGTYGFSDLQENILVDVGPTLLLQIPSIFIQNIPTVIINWLIFNAIQNWLHAIVTRSETSSFPIQPFARSINNWFLFTLILLGLNTISQIFSGLFFALFPTIMNSISSTPEEQDREIILFITRLLSFFTIPIFLGILTTTIYFLLILWSRQYAVGIGHILDSTLKKKVDSPSQPAEW